MIEPIIALLNNRPVFIQKSTNPLVVGPSKFDVYYIKPNTNRPEKLTISKTHRAELKLQPFSIEQIQQLQTEALMNLLPTHFYSLDVQAKISELINEYVVPNQK